MKTLNNIITLAMIFFFSINSFASGFGMQDEKYIDDIPFNTKTIFDSIQKDNDPAIVMKEEAYINDIPFDTEQIVAQYRSDSAMQVNYELPEEETINDIPFNTLYIASKMIYHDYDRRSIIFVSTRN